MESETFDIGYATRAPVLREGLLSDPERAIAIRASPSTRTVRLYGRLSGHREHLRLGE